MRHFLATSTLYFASALFIMGCNGKLAKQNKPLDMKRQSQQLTIKTTATPAGTLGYGYLYKCGIKEVLEGDLEEGNINLVVLANDHDHIEFLAAHQAPTEIEITFKFRKTNEPYARMPLTGFVDKNRTSWEVTTMK